MEKGVVLSAEMATLNGFKIGLCLLLKTVLGVGFVLFQICCCTVTPIKAVLGNRSQFKAIVTLIEKQEQLFFWYKHAVQCTALYAV